MKKAIKAIFHYWKSMEQKHKYSPTDAYTFATVREKKKQECRLWNWKLETNETIGHVTEIWSTIRTDSNIGNRSLTGGRKW